ncbi:hypothetical protein BSKO_05572 [Bryopsis sp. KO-2023]|nr:hypothetical protein BSKO_05572 [Bryopsis sp. KO-2023]
MGRIQKRLLAERRQRDVCFLLSDNAVAVVIGILGVLAMGLVGSFQWRDSSWTVGVDGPLGSEWPMCTAALVPEKTLQESKSEPHILVRTTTSPPFWISLLPENRDPLGFEIAITGLFYDGMLTRVVETYLKHWTGRAVVDVGSTVGWLSVFSAKLGYKSYVFETDPFALVKLCQSKSANRLQGFMEIVDFPVGNRPNNGTLKDGESLDGYLQEQGCPEKVSLLSVLGDGAFSELAVLTGAWEFIERCDVQLVYLGMDGEAPVDFQRSYQRLTKSGFVVYGIAQETQKGMVYYSSLAEIEKTLDPVAKACGQRCNVLWVKTEKLEEAE